MILRAIIISNVFILSSILFYQCISYDLIDESNQIRFFSKDLQISPKLGVAVLFSSPNNPYRPTEELLEITKKAQ